ncbi:integrase [Prosthecomicrobium hirschii]|uniref:integrase core domain-containing protein n=1 Tax=Prosthecodimorpha hirschii TaxID=665126 RepID=UPI001125C3BB|nr:integrase core domain-containing protein [Prosthecomicrobium hirschii]TPQ48768.1 integrase [Prosthecomicrobium hirschii]
MPWNEICVVDERMRFVLEHGEQQTTMTELCERYGVSRETGYESVRRYRSAGPVGLCDRPRGAHVHGRATADAVCVAILALRRDRPSWGPRKIVAKLAAGSPEIAWPSPSTAGEILKRAGLVTGRRRVRRAPPRLGELTEPRHANHVWRADHKGWVSLGDRARLEPLTVTDGFSRFVILLEAAGSARTEEAKPLFEKAFREHGLPEVIHSDNGPPFASTGVTGLTELGVWWIKLGIRHERIDPGQPQQNGSHERFHGVLSAEAMRPPAAYRAAQQNRFDAFRRDYNEERPHEALGQTPPASFYKAANPRAMPDRPAEPDYPPEAAVRRVRSTGEIRWGGALVYMSAALTGETVAVEEDADGSFAVRYFDREVGVIDPRTRKLRRRILAPRGEDAADQPHLTL